MGVAGLAPITAGDSYTHAGIVVVVIISTLEITCCYGNSLKFSIRLKKKLAFVHVHIDKADVWYKMTYAWK